MRLDVDIPALLAQGRQIAGLARLDVTAHLQPPAETAVVVQEVLSTDLVLWSMQPKHTR